MQTFLDGRVTLYRGDCLEVLAALPENSVDSAVLDPPYHLTSIVERFGGEGAAELKSGRTGAYKRAAAGFMGKAWDGGDIAFRVATWKAVLRVLKPGAYILAFASTRGFGRMSVAIEDAGFITLPMIAWVFGAGMPKATRLNSCSLHGPFAGIDVNGWRYGGQALKPAIEPIYMGQKPFSEKTGTANVLLHGTGALNIDGCRVGDEERSVQIRDIKRMHGGGYANQDKRGGGVVGEKVETGRWPANLIHDGSDEVLEAFPDSPGQKAPSLVDGSEHGNSVYGSMRHTGPQHLPRDDTGSAARFFYSAKADADDRIGSKHPTVKPVDLMRYLCRLVTPPGGTVLDPFAGTGTTGEAAWREGFSSILIEREAEYQADITERMRLCLAGPGERSREISRRKAAGQPQDLGPLFNGAPK